MHPLLPYLHQMHECNLKGTLHHGTTLAGGQ